MHPKIRLYLSYRDDAYARRDAGVVRSMNAELRRLGVRDDATVEHPDGAPKNGRKETAKKQVPKLPRCEHGNVMERCGDCNEELAAH